MITCPKCGKPSWELAASTTNRSKFCRYDYSRYRHPKRQYGKVKTCYVPKKKINLLASGEIKSKLCQRHLEMLRCHGNNRWIV